jgi:hypothetical protein
MLNSVMTPARALILTLLAALGPAVPVRATEGQPVVVVELFTSQGCSSCPPADKYLGEIAARPDVLALSWHVDYWNYIGWTDPFASKQATQRQRDYSHHLNMRYVYTPQMVINGVSEGVGSEPKTIDPLIKAAAQNGLPRQHLAVARELDRKLSIHVDAGSTGEPATVWLVGFDREHATQVARGENEGQTLREYQIVRTCEAIATWTGEALDITVDAGQVGGDGGVAVLLQLGAGTGRIIGAALLKPPTS